MTLRVRIWVHKTVKVGAICLITEQSRMQRVTLVAGRIS